MNRNGSDYLLEKFVVRGLHGYKDISVEFAGVATVIVAENGAGKTTVLNILNAFLSCRFHRLTAFSFSSIECKFRDELFPVVLHRNMLSESNNVEAEEEIRTILAQTPLSEAELLDFLTRTYFIGNFTAFRTHRVPLRLFLDTSRTWDKVEQTLDNLYLSLDSSLTAESRNVILQVRRCLNDIEIVFLPTYRRIERPQLRPRQNTKVGPASAQRVAGSTVIKPDNDMVFGLTDVEARLAEMSDEIERRSNQGYRSLSTRILDEMLKGMAIRESEIVSIADLPDIESLTRFLSRVDKQENRAGVVFSNIEALYKTRQIESADNWFLRYFLSRLAQVIEQTREMEKKVQQFVDVCNSYLSDSSDEKKMSFDPQTLRVVVEDLWAKRTFTLDALSSGEKQIVSLMARLYLHSKPKIVLIDEPELSLSLPWQRRVLPDIVNSGNVSQLLAITHSPFVFENELDGCARPMRIHRSVNENG